MKLNTFLLEIVTPERKLFSKPVRMIVAKGVEGELGILPKHIPLVTSLRIAPLKIQSPDQKDEFIAINGGFMEVRSDKVVILAESAELPESIDIERAKSAKERAEQRLNEKSSQIDLIRAENSLKRALTRIEVSQKS
jgi:F-type H+-transporting ATPase subunit epsilon